MASSLPRLNIVVSTEMRQWVEAQRLPCQSASDVVRRLILQAMTRPNP